MPTVIPPPIVEQDDGAISRALGKLLGKSWRTSLLGVLAMLSGIIPMIPDIDPKWAQVTLAVLTGTGLMLSKDRNVSGQPTTDQTP